MVNGTTGLIPNHFIQTAYFINKPLNLHVENKKILPEISGSSFIYTFLCVCLLFFFCVVSCLKESFC